MKPEQSVWFVIIVEYVHMISQLVSGERQEFRLLVLALHVKRHFPLLGNCLVDFINNLGKD